MKREKLTFGKNIVFIFSLILLLIESESTFANVKLPAVISDNMILQQGQAVPIWGWADPGGEVMVSVSWIDMEWAVTADKDGKWFFKMKSPEIGGPYQMTFQEENLITINNILVGEVWVCSGQSNMEWPVSQAANHQQEIAAANYPNIRLFTVGRKVAEQPQSDCTGSWVLCNPETVPRFSAVAYYFGRELHKEIGVPIGLIHTSWGGTPAEAWTRQEILETDSDFAPILKRYADTVARYPQLRKEYRQQINEWKKALAKAEGKQPPERPSEPIGRGHPYSPTGLYNAMIAPLIPYAIRGAIWYQGESNAGRAYQYRKLFPAMIQNWRKDWGQGDFPFLFVQLANYKAVKAEPSESDWAELREAQLMTLSLHNTGMAVTIDIGEANNIHPKNKQDVGKRLALWALAKTYRKDIVYSGPLYKSMEVQDNKIVLHFNHVNGGLVARDGETLRGFAIAGENQKFVWADAKIVGDNVVVSSDQVPEPVAARYAWADNPLCNLYNKEVLPASPFRTDDWPGVTFGRK
jgi:sialate O-acetylesterase